MCPFTSDGMFDFSFNQESWKAPLTLSVQPFNDQNLTVVDIVKEQLINAYIFWKSGVYYPQSHIFRLIVKGIVS
jgi:hypothetical protein